MKPILYGAFLGTAAGLLFGLLSLTSGGLASNIAQPSKPTGPAGGDLSGTYPNPTVAKVNGGTPGGNCTGVIQSATINSTGLGYHVNDTFTVTGGTILATGTVTSADIMTGAVAGFTLNTGGAGYSGSFASTVATSGTGNNAFSLNIAVGSGVVTSLTTSAVAGCNPLPAPTATLLGGVKSIAAVAHQFITALSTAGAFTQAQPACGDLSNAAASCSTDTTNAANITAGLLPLARFPPFGSLTAATGNLTTTETVVTFFSAAGGTFTAGGMVRVVAQGSCTEGVTPASSLYRIRIGPTTLTGTALGISSPTFLTSVSNKHFDLAGYVTIRSVVTTTATADSSSTLVTDPTLQVFGASSFGGSSGNTFDPTVTNRVELTFQTGNAGDSCSFFTALLEQVI